MSAEALGRIIAKRSVTIGRAGAQSGGSVTAETLLKTIGGYIPTEVTTAYVALAGGIASLPSPGMPWMAKLWVAIAGAAIAAFVAWVIGHRAAQKRAVANSATRPNAGETFRAGWYEILAAAMALFIWATAMPDSWVDWGQYLPFLPTAVVAVASIVLGGVAVLMNRDSGGP